jgi:hypothetical protein
MYSEVLSCRTEWHSGNFLDSYSLGSQFNPRPNIGYPEDLKGFLQFFFGARVGHDLFPQILSIHHSYIVLPFEAYSPATDVYKYRPPPQRKRGTLKF